MGMMKLPQKDLWNYSIKLLIRPIKNLLVL